MNLPAGAALYLVLYVATLVVHVFLISYVLVGAGWLAVIGLRGKDDDRVAATFRDWLPFALGAAITAGVAPLLFVQILYQERFYTANLLLSHRWMAVIPALIVGFYALYLAKSTRAQRWKPRWRAGVASLATVCFVFVAWSWTENHLLSLRPEKWASMYGAGTMVHTEAQLAPRLLLWLTMALPIAATGVAWQVADDRAALCRLRIVALAGLAAAAGAGAWLFGTLSPAAQDLVTGGGGPAAMALVGAPALAFAASWGLVCRVERPRGMLLLSTVLLVIAVTAGAVLRERLRLPMLLAVRPRAVAAGGMTAFFIFLAINTALITWCVRSALRHLRTVPPPSDDA